MAIIKVVKKSGKTKVALKNVLAYVGKKAYKTFGINCDHNYENVTNDFLETKEYFKKENGRQYRHYIQSFAAGEITESEILELSLKWAKECFKGYEVFVAVHNDKNHLHTHFIVNSVNRETGIKLHETNAELKSKKRKNDEICLEYGIDNSKLGKEKTVGEVVAYDKNKYQIIKKGGDITRLAERVLEIALVSTSKEEFINLMAEKGYSVQWQDNHKHITFNVDPKILEGKKKKFRLNNLKKTFNIPLFTKESLLEQFNENIKTKLEKENTIQQDLDEIATLMNFDKEITSPKENVEVKKNKKRRNASNSTTKKTIKNNGKER